MLEFKENGNPYKITSYEFKFKFKDWLRYWIYTYPDFPHDGAESLLVIYVKDYLKDAFPPTQWDEMVKIATEAYHDLQLIPNRESM